MSIPIRVLVVDDSVVVRRLVGDVLAADPSITVVGTASNGRVALARIDQLSPDLVTLDIEMPELDGLETLKRLRRTHPKLPVIMFSTLTQRAAAATIEALTLGANDYVTKPEGTGNLDAARDLIRQTLIPKIKACCGRSVEKFAVSQIARAAASRDGQRVRAIAIGVSTGGPPALQTLVSALPHRLAVPVFIVQHMPPVFTTMLAKRLAALTPLPVVEATTGMKVVPGSIYLAPGDFHMALVTEGTDTVIKLTQAPPENSCRPSVDVTFRSAVELYGAGVLGVILTGMGQDGLRGCELVRAQGGGVVVQDQATSVVWGMPGAVARAGLADIILPIGEVAGELARRAERPAQKRAS